MTKRVGLRAGARRAPVRRRRTPDEAKLEIIEVARQFLTKRPFRELTIGKLMRRTQIGRSAFYAYFNDVYALAEYFIHELARALEAKAADWLTHDGDQEAQIRAAMETAIVIWEENGALIRSLEQAAAQDPRLERIWRDRVARGPVDRIAEIIRKHQKAGLIPPIDAYEMSVALNRFNMTYLNDRLGVPRADTDRNAIRETIVRVWVGALYGGESFSAAASGAAARRAKR